MTWIGVILTWSALLRSEAWEPFTLSQQKEPSASSKQSSTDPPVFPNWVAVLGNGHSNFSPISANMIRTPNSFDKRMESFFKISTTGSMWVDSEYPVVRKNKLSTKHFCPGPLCHKRPSANEREANPGLFVTADGFRSVCCRRCLQYRRDRRKARRLMKVNRAHVHPY